MSAKLKFRRSPYGLTTLELRGQDFDLELKLVSRLGKRERRAILRSFLSQIKPWLHYFRDGAIDHPDCAIIRSTRARQRGVRDDESLSIATPTGSMGYEIRIKRLRLGLTQDELARRLGLSRPHLSAVERGHFTPRPKTWRLIREFLDQPVPGFDDELG